MNSISLKKIRLNEEERENGLRNFDYHEKIEDNQENMKDIHESEEENKAANYYSNDDIELALSGLTTNELQLLSHLVEEEDSIKSKRDTSKLKKKLKLSNKERIEDEEETDYDNDYMEMSSSKKRANCRGLCQAGSCIHSTREIEDEEEENEDEGRLNKRKFTPFRKRNSESPEKKIKARISSLKDKAKIHSFGKKRKHRKYST